MLVFLIAITSLAVASTGALAKTKTGPTYVPPGQSAASQYTEDVPTAGGNAPVSGLGSSGGGSGPGSISAKTLHQLDHSGSAGAAAASLARSLAPAARTTPAERAATATPAGSTTATSQAGAPAQVIKTLGGSDAGGGIGFLLPTILMLSLVGATALGLMRIRRTA